MTKSYINSRTINHFVIYSYIQYKMKAPQVSDKCVSTLNLSSSFPAPKNSSLSFGGGYSQSSGWNANITYTKKW